MSRNKYIWNIIMTMIKYYNNISMQNNLNDMKNIKELGSASIGHLSIFKKITLISPYF